MIPYSATDQFGPHPNHHRNFFSKNLMCCKCKASCGVCDEPCCAFKALLQLTIAHKGTELGQECADSARTISKYYTPRDESTFLECTECRKSVCPSCIGICPIYPCRDQQCKECKPDQGAMCDFHDEEDIHMSPICQENAVLLALGNNASVGGLASRRN